MEAAPIGDAAATTKESAAATSEVRETPTTLEDAEGASTLTSFSKTKKITKNEYKQRRICYENVRASL